MKVLIVLILIGLLILGVVLAVFLLRKPVCQLSEDQKEIYTLTSEPDSTEYTFECKSGWWGDESKITYEPCSDQEPYFKSIQGCTKICDLKEDERDKYVLNPQIIADGPDANASYSITCKEDYEQEGDEIKFECNDGIITFNEGFGCKERLTCQAGEYIKDNNCTPCPSGKTTIPDNDSEECFLDKDILQEQSRFFVMNESCQITGPQSAGILSGCSFPIGDASNHSLLYRSSVNADKDIWRLLDRDDGQYIIDNSEKVWADPKEGKSSWLASGVCNGLGYDVISGPDHGWTSSDLVKKAFSQDGFSYAQDATSRAAGVLWETLEDVEPSMTVCDVTSCESGKLCDGYSGLDTCSYSRVINPPDYSPMRSSYSSCVTDNGNNDCKKGRTWGGPRNYPATRSDGWDKRGALGGTAWENRHNFVFGAYYMRMAATAGWSSMKYGINEPISSPENYSNQEQIGAPWIQIDMEESTTIDGILTQGAAGAGPSRKSQGEVYSYKIAVYNNGEWTFVKPEDTPESKYTGVSWKLEDGTLKEWGTMAGWTEDDGLFKGNHNIRDSWPDNRTGYTLLDASETRPYKEFAEDIHYSKLKEPVTTTKVRIYPMHYVGHMLALRWGLMRSSCDSS